MSSNGSRDTRFTFAGIIQIVFTLILAAFGVVGYIYGARGTWVDILIDVVWFIIFMSTGILAVTAGNKPRNKCVRISTLVMSVISAVIAGICIVGAVLVVLGLSVIKDDDYYDDYYDEGEEEGDHIISTLRIAFIIGLVVFILQFVLAIVISAFSCCGKKREKASAVYKHGTIA